MEEQRFKSTDKHGMRTHYLAVLGLSSDASERDIKTAYRRLAKQYHPDRSPSPQAAQFALITEAYDYLLAPAARESLPTDPLTDWRAEARERILREKVAQRQQRETLLGKIYKVLNYVMAVPVLLNILLIIDYYAPATVQQEPVVAVEKVGVSAQSTGNDRQWQYDRVYFRAFEMVVDQGTAIPLADIREAQVTCTPILHTVKQASYTLNQQEEVITPIYNIYHVFGYLIPVILIGILAYFRLPSHSEHRLTLAIMVFIIFFGQMGLLLL